MELKLKKHSAVGNKKKAFNRTAYGIEILILTAF